MEKHSLSAQKRIITGKKVKTLRKQGLLPANIYGKNIKSQAAQVDLKEFQKVYEEVGETGLIDLLLGDKETRPVLIHNVQLDPIKSLPLHTDFYQVSLKEKVTAMVPVIFVGDSPAVVNKEGVLLTVLDEVEVEALPTDLPENIELDVSKLTAIDQELKVKDLKIDKTKIEIKSDPNLTLVKIGPLITEEMKKEMEEEKAKAKAEAAAAAPPAGGPAEGAAPPPEGAPPAKEAKPTETPKKEEQPKPEEKK